MIASGTAIVLAIIGATWKVSGRLGSIETNSAVLTERVNGIADDIREVKERIGKGGYQWRSTS